LSFNNYPSFQILTKCLHFTLIDQGINQNAQQSGDGAQLKGLIAPSFCTAKQQFNPSDDKQQA
jgi:hypothetical protein